MLRGVTQPRFRVKKILGFDAVAALPGKIISPLGQLDFEACQIIPSLPSGQVPGVDRASKSRASVVRDWTSARRD